MSRDDAAPPISPRYLSIKERISSDLASGPDCGGGGEEAGGSEVGGAAGRGSGRRDGVRGGGDGGGGGGVRADAARAAGGRGGRGGRLRRERDDEVVEEVVEPDRVEVAHLSYEWGSTNVGTGMWVGVLRWERCGGIGSQIGSKTQTWEPGSRRSREQQLRIEQSATWRGRRWW